MGRLILVILIVVAIVLVWKAFGPSSRNRNAHPTPGGRFPFGSGKTAPQQRIVAPDDDPDFLWKLEKAQWEAKRKRQRQQQQHQQQQHREREEMQRRQQQREDGDDTD